MKNEMTEHSLILETNFQDHPSTTCKKYCDGYSMIPSRGTAYKEDETVYNEGDPVAVGNKLKLKCPDNHMWYNPTTHHLDIWKFAHCKHDAEDDSHYFEVFI